MLESLLVIAVLLLALFVLIWYVVGVQINTRRVREALTWLQNGLPTVGDKASLSWYGASQARIQLLHAKEPFRSVEVLISLAPRQIPFWWLWRKRHRERDSLVFRAQLRSAPRFDLVAHTPSVGPDEQLKRSGSGQWRAVQGGLADEMNADIRGSISPFSVNRLIVLARMEGVTLTRLVVHRSVPNLQLQFDLPSFHELSSLRFFSNLKQLGEEVHKL